MTSARQRTWTDARASAASRARVSGVAASVDYRDGNGVLWNVFDRCWIDPTGLSACDDPKTRWVGRQYATLRPRYGPVEVVGASVDPSFTGASYDAVTGLIDVFASGHAPEIHAAGSEPEPQAIPTAQPPASATTTEASSAASAAGALAIGLGVVALMALVILV